jgi:hypothetical protein
MAMGEAIERMSAETGYRFGPRGWAYYAEGLGLITKGEFDRFEKLLTDMRKDGELDPDVIEPDASRTATDVDDFDASEHTPEQHAQAAVDDIGDQPAFLGDRLRFTKAAIGTAWTTTSK